MKTLGRGGMGEQAGPYAGTGRLLHIAPWRAKPRALGGPPGARCAALAQLVEHIIRNKMR